MESLLKYRSSKCALVQTCLKNYKEIIVHKQLLNKVTLTLLWRLLVAFITNHFSQENVNQTFKRNNYLRLWIWKIAFVSKLLNHNSEVSKKKKQRRNQRKDTKQRVRKNLLKYIKKYHKIILSDYNSQPRRISGA